MKRRISEGLVPEWFFDCIEPDFKAETLIENLKYRKDFKTVFLQSPVTAILLPIELRLKKCRIEFLRKRKELIREKP